MEKIELGDVAKDKITGLKGVIVAITEWLYACRRITIQPQNLGKDGQPLDTYTCDEPQVELVKKAGFKVVPEEDKAPKEKTGGPSIKPVARGGPF